MLRVPVNLVKLCSGCKSLKTMRVNVVGRGHSPIYVPGCNKNLRPSFTGKCLVQDQTVSVEGAN